VRQQMQGLGPPSVRSVEKRNGGGRIVFSLSQAYPRLPSDAKGWRLPLSLRQPTPVLR